MYKFTIENNTIFRDKLSGQNGILIEREPILDKDTLLSAFDEWVRPLDKEKGLIRNSVQTINGLIEKWDEILSQEHCRTNPTDDCPNCPRYKDDCEGLEQYEDIFGIQDELDKLTIRPDGTERK